MPQTGNLQDDELIDGVMTFEEITDDIHVAVQSYFLSSQSEPDENQYVWAYRIKITNQSDVPVQLISRHWIITDGTGFSTEVKGEGVVGEQPVIMPGDSFTYTSGTPLSTPTGFMRGSYQMHKGIDGASVDVVVPVFSLDSPHVSLSLN